MSWYLSIAVSFLPLVWLVPLSPRCKYILQCVCLECLVAQSHPTLCDPMDCMLPGSSIHGDYPGKNTGVGCHAVLQGIFPTQGLNLGLLHFQQIHYHLSYQGSPSHSLLQQSKDTVYKGVIHFGLCISLLEKYGEKRWV